MPSGGWSGGGPASNERGDMEHPGQERKEADRWVPWHSSGAWSNELESVSKFKWFK
jgi:hypothetical protein